MTILISKDGEKAERIEKSAFDNEDYLQQHIHDNPESIPLYEIKEDIKLLIIAREFQTNSGPIDAIGVDAQGDLYIVETKLYRNPDKRTVIAQSLDYGAALWKHTNNFSHFISMLDSHCQKKFGCSFDEKIQEFFSYNEDEVIFLKEKMQENINDGIFQFVILMDEIKDRLKDLILFVNQNSQFTVYAVEFSYYKHGSQEIIIPRIFGNEVKKDIGVKSSSQRKPWNETTLIHDAKEKLDDKTYGAFMKLYNFSKQHASQINYGSGSNASFSPIYKELCSMSLYTLTTDTRLSLNFEWIAKENDVLVEKYKDKLTAIGFDIADEYKNIRPSVMPDVWVDKVDVFCEVLESLLSE